MGATPKDVIAQFNEIVGVEALTPGVRDIRRRVDAARAAAEAPKREYDRQHRREPEPGQRVVEVVVAQVDLERGPAAARRPPALGASSSI